LQAENRRTASDRDGPRFSLPAEPAFDLAIVTQRTWSARSRDEPD